VNIELTVIATGEVNLDELPQIKKDLETFRDRTDHPQGATGVHVTLQPNGCKDTYVFYYMSGKEMMNMDRRWMNREEIYR